MNNEPVAWISNMTLQNLQMPFLSQVTHRISVKANTMDDFTIPLYTHPAKHLSLQKVDGELVAVTYTDDEHRIIEVLWEKPPAKTLTDEEIWDLMDEIEMLAHGDIKRAMYRMARKVESILNE